MIPPDQSTVRLPRSALATLSHRCAGLGTSGVQALREAGYRAGSEILGALHERPTDLPSSEFWTLVATLFENAGLGSIGYEPVSPALGAVAWRGSAEAAGGRPDREKVSCHFAGGLLGGVLSRAAGRTVDVVEIRCGGGGSRPCWFLFGSVETLRAVRERAVRRPEDLEPPADGRTS